MDTNIAYLILRKVLIKAAKRFVHPDYHNAYHNFIKTADVVFLISKFPNFYNWIVENLPEIEATKDSQILIDELQKTDNELVTDFENNEDYFAEQSIMMINEDDSWFGFIGGLFMIDWLDFDSDWLDIFSS